MAEENRYNASEECGCCSAGAEHSHPHEEHHSHGEHTCLPDEVPGAHIGCDCCDHDEHGGASKKVMVMRLLAGAAVFALTFFVPDGVMKYAVAIIAYIILGYDVVISALKNHKMDENMLMCIASVGALIIGECSEGVAVMLFFQTGEFFQDLAVNRSRKSIASLMDIKSDTAKVLRGNEEVIIDCREVNVGDTVIVSAGERIPLDGVIAQGETSIDTSALTGESLPADVTQGSEVLSGSINLSKTVKITVTKPFGESTVAKILEMVENASAKKAPAEKFITKFARYYTPVVVIAALLAAVIPPLFFGGEWSLWVYRGLSFLVVSCPCALVISVPLSFFAGIGGASKQGILIKGSNYMEALASATAAVFDKTGTLTKGAFAVDKIVDSDDSQYLLSIAAHLENYSSHPIGKSIVKAYGKKIDSSVVSGVGELAGKGIKGTIGDVCYYAGNAKLMNELGFDPHSGENDATAVYVASDEKYLGAIIIRDEIKDDAFDGLRALEKCGVKKTAMLTGDNDAVAQGVAKKLGVTDVYSQLLPQDKVEMVEKLKKEQPKGEGLIFTGDGINDAPVLAMADIGIAMGGVGSDAAIEAADVVLMTDSIAKIPTAIKICRKTLKIVKENIIIALAVKIIIMVLVAVGLSGMWLAIFADVGVSLLAVLNAMRCLKTPK